MATPLPIVHLVAGVVAVTAAVGTWRLMWWGRWVTVGYVACATVDGLGRWAYRAADIGIGWNAVGLIVGLAFDVAVVWVLATRWPKDEGRHAPGS